MSDLGFNIWGTVGGVVFALVPLLVMWHRARLPSKNLPYLLDLMKETRDLFVTALREGLLTDEADLRQININMLHATLRVDEIRAAVYESKTWLDDVKNWWRGLTGKISTLYCELNETRVRLARITSKGRKLRVSQSAVSDTSLLLDEKGPIHIDSPRVQVAAPHPPCVPFAPALQARDMRQAAGLHGQMNMTEGTKRRLSGHGESLTGELGDGGCPPPYPIDQPQLTAAGPTHRVISVADGDLRDLLSLLLLHPLSEPDAAKRERAMRRKVLLLFGKQLCGMDNEAGLSNIVVGPDREKHTASDRSGDTASLGEGRPLDPAD